MNVLKRNNIFFFIAVILLSVMIFCTRHYVQPFLSDASTAEYLGPFPLPLEKMVIDNSSNLFIDAVIIFTSLFIMGTYFFSDKKLRIFLWGIVLMGFVIMSVAMLLLKYLTGI